MWVEQKNPWTTLVSLCLSIGQYRLFSLCIGLQCFGSSGSKVATFPYKCSRRSTLCQLPAPAGNRNFQYKCSTQSTFWQLQLESSNFSVVCARTLWQLRLESRSFSVQASVVWCSIRSTFWQLHSGSRNFSVQM